MKKLLFLLLLCSGTAFGQAAFYQLPAPLPNATMYVCPVPSTLNPCATPSPIFQDQALSIAITQPIHVGKDGNMGFWATPGQYTIQIQSPYNLVYVISLGGSGGGTTIVTNQPFLLRTNSPNGTTVGQLVTYDCAHTDNNGFCEVQNAVAGAKNVIGVCVATCGTSGIATIGTYLSAPVIMDGAATAGDVVSPSGSVAGFASDENSINAQPNVQTIGRISKANTGGAGTAAIVDFFLGDIQSPGSSGSGNAILTPCAVNGCVINEPIANTQAITGDNSFFTNGTGTFTAVAGNFTGPTNGAINLFGIGTPAAGPPTAAVQFTVPNSVTAYTNVFPGAAGTGCVQASNSSGTVTWSFTGVNCGAGSGSVTSITATSPIVVTPSPLTTTGVISCPTCATGSTITTQTNGVNNSSQTTLNLQNSSTVNGFQVTQTNSSGGNVQLGIITPALPTFSQVPQPTAPTLTVNGTPGSTTISYAVVACQDTACTQHSQASNATTVTTANGTLSSTNSVTLTAYFPTTQGTSIRCYNIYRTATNGTSPTTTGLIAGCASISQITDSGLAGVSSTAPNTNTTVLMSNPQPLPGCPIAVGGLAGIDAPPCTMKAASEECTETFGVPGDVNNTQWTWQNQGTSTLTMSNGECIINAQSVGGQNQYRYLTQPAPATPWTIVCAEAYPPTGGASNDGSAAFMIKDSSGAKFISFDTGNNLLEVAHWTSQNVVATTPFSSTAVHDTLVWTYLKVQDTGTNLIFSHSPDGINYFQDLSESRTVFLTSPAFVGWGAQSSSGVNPSVGFDYCRQTQ